jgi:uncharacterized repeat protein (TIGR03803 family)
MKRSLIVPLSSLFTALLLAGCGGGTSQTPYAYRLRYSFGAQGDGQTPNGGLVADAAGNLYGTTERGGSAYGGTIFSLKAKTDAETVLYSFLQQDPTEGYKPNGPLTLDSAGKLYGTTAAGGTDGFGTAFTLDPTSQAKTVLWGFRAGQNDGAYPGSPLLRDAQGDLFGTTENGGPAETGTVFEIKAGTSTATVIATFGDPATGAAADPTGQLAMDANGNLYGTSQAGGTDHRGTVWEVPAANSASPGAVTVLHDFAGQPGDGTGPVGGVVLDATQTILYGTTEYGGTNGTGTVFSVATDGSASNMVYAFGTASSNDGALPMAPLVMGSKGMLYGTTDQGGAGYGTVFSVDPASGAEKLLHTFGGFVAGDGANPGRASLMIDASGQLVGVTRGGGKNDFGTVYSLAP